MDLYSTIYFHSKDDLPGNPPAICDFLSLRKNDSLFTEKYILNIIKNSNFFIGQELQVIESQSHSEADIIDINSKTLYEVKTFLNQSGCESLSLGKIFLKTFESLLINETIEEQLNNWDKPEKYDKITKKIISKMKKKQMDYIIFMLTSFCLESNSSFSSICTTDIDVEKWQYILKLLSYRYKVYIIKPTLFNQFAIYQISTSSINKEIIDFKDFFDKYITIKRNALK